MANLLEGKDSSLWIETTPQTNYPQLKNDSDVYDLAIIGGGITGLMGAYYAQEQGLKVALVEKSRIVEWTTGQTTAKLSSQHYLIYDYLIKRHGQTTAQAFADANQRGIDEIEKVGKRLQIDHEFARKSAYVYSQHQDKLQAIKDEVAASTQLGLPASFEATIDLPIAIAGAVKFSNQAQFHPRKFLLGVAEHFVKNGGSLYEHTEAKDIIEGPPHQLVTDQGTIQAKHILQASGKPFWHGDIFNDFMWEKVSYALGVKLETEAKYPEDVYITTDQPMRTIRSANYEGQPILIFGGESHEYHDETFEEDMNLHYSNLISDVHQHFAVDKILFRWLASDHMPYDRIPYIGVMPQHPGIYVITGYRAWGLAWAMSATKAIVNDIIGQPESWVSPFALDRLSIALSQSDKQHAY